MKQISKRKAQDLADRELHLKTEIRFCESDWIKQNACRIADIECGRADKTYYGEYPKGWKTTMKAEAVRNAQKRTLRQFIESRCCVIDGRIWLNDWQLINELATEESPG